MRKRTTPTSGSARVDAALVEADEARWCLPAGLVFAKSAARQRPYLYRVTGPPASERPCGPLPPIEASGAGVWAWVCLTLPRPLHHCCCRAGEGGQGEAQVPRPAAAGSAPSPPLSSAPARTALACACDEGAGDGERLLSHRRRHNPPQSRRCEKAPRRCAAPPLLQQTGGRVGTKIEWRNNEA